MSSPAFPEPWFELRFRFWAAARELHDGEWRCVWHGMSSDRGGPERPVVCRGSMIGDGVREKLREEVCLAQHARFNYVLRRDGVGWAS